MSKVPHVTLAFWIIKIAATTLGETGGDFLSMTLNLGYLESTAILGGLFALALALQIAADRYHPFIYWAVIVATTLAGTTLSDYLDRSAGLGYIGGSGLLIAMLIAILAVWRLATGSISVDRIVTPKVELFYWTAILVSNTLGTALGDFLSTSSGLGYEGAALVLAVPLALIAAGYFLTHVSHTVLFWLAFVLTRPLGAALGDFLTKPLAEGGLSLDRLESSAVIIAFVAAMVLVTQQKAKQPAVEGASG